MFPISETGAEEAYNMWSQYYDTQPDNLILALDDVLFTKLIAGISLQNKIIADVGCGTGRHWGEIYAKHPLQVTGFDISEGMLKVLKQKFPLAQAYQAEASQLKQLQSKSCDVVISTLALAHIKNMDKSFAEWDRILKADGHIIITDYHPDILAKGGDRTFTYQGKRIAIKNYIHPIKKIRALSGKLKFQINEFYERRIEEAVKHYYERQNAIKVYERFKGIPVIYGVHLTRVNAVM